MFQQFIATHNHPPVGVIVDPVQVSSSPGIVICNRDIHLASASVAGLIDVSAGYFGLSHVIQLQPYPGNYTEFVCSVAGNIDLPVEAGEPVTYALFRYETDAQLLNGHHILPDSLNLDIFPVAPISSCHDGKLLRLGFNTAVSVQANSRLPENKYVYFGLFALATFTAGKANFSISLNQVLEELPVFQPNK